MMLAYARAEVGATPYFRSWFAVSALRQFAGDARQRLHVGSVRGAQHGVHHAGQTDLRSDPLQYEHVTVTRGDDMPISLAAHHEADHLATDIAPPPTGFQRAVGPTEGVDHRGDLGVGFAENVQYALGGEVASDLLPDDVAQLRLRDVEPDAQRGRELRQAKPVGDDQHPVDGDFDPDDVVDVRGVATCRSHGHPACTCPSSALPIASSIWS